MKSQFIISSPTSGSGKTIFTLGLLRLLQRQGVKVQPFKCGPDFINSQYHALACGTESVNLDSWLASRTHVQHLYNVYGEQADVCAIEGHQGLYDGYNRMQGSSAEIASMLGIPVILVVNARSTSYSVSPLLFGFKNYKKEVKIAGVIFNQVSSPAHYAVLRGACQDAGIECLGYLPIIDDLKFPSRHNGLTLSVRQQIQQEADRVAGWIEKYVAVDRLMNRCIRIFPCSYTLPVTSDVDNVPWHLYKKQPMRIAVARDPAFCFLYREHLDALSALGEVTFFSPVYGNELPSADLVYLPGGFPELFARQLYRRKQLLQQLRDYAEAGGRILAEGSAISLLAHSLTTRTGGTAYEMAGIFPIDCTSASTRLSMGYRTAEYAGICWKGYEYHFSMINEKQKLDSAACLYNPKGSEVPTALYRYKNVIAGYTHWYWGEQCILDLWKSSK